MLADIFGPDLLIVLIVVAVVLFGGAAIPRLARNLGSAKTEFEKGMKEGASNGATPATPATTAASVTPATSATPPEEPADS